MITRIQVAAARGILDWSIQKLADESGLSVPPVQAFLAGKNQIKASTAARMREALERAGIELIDGGARLRQDVVRIYEGDDCYIRFLDDALAALAPARGEILFSGADDRRSPPEVIEKMRTMRAAGITMRSLIRPGDDYLIGQPDEYRWMPDGLFVEGDVKIVGGGMVAHLMSWLGTPRIVILQDDVIEAEALRLFNYLWNRARGPEKSSATVFYE
jgi:transcriptional regulator with XRE-family HTH domain